MSVNYLIKADVVDLRSDSPQEGDSFMVDTNIWYWLTYTRASQGDQPPMTHQVSEYPSYISKAISSKAKLFRCEISMAELSHLIERTEREIFVRSHGFISPKEYRHNCVSERNSVVGEIQASWGQVKTMASPVDFLLDEATTEIVVNRLGTVCIDSYDLFFLEAISKAGLIQIITDDGDFSTIPNIRVFTANNNVIQTAQTQGKLVVRSNS